MTEQELRDFYNRDLQWCQCGQPDRALAFLAEVLAALEPRSEGDTPDDTWEKPLRLLGMAEHPGLAYGYLYMLGAHDLTEHGGQIQGCWLTEKGKAVLAAIQSADLEKLFD